MPEGSDCWAGLLWVRDTAGNITSMANFLPKQLRLFRLAQKITAWWGVNNSAVWWHQRNFACIFRKLEPPSLTPLQDKSSQNAFFFFFNLLVLVGERKKKTDRHCVTSSGEEVYYSSLNSTIHQTDGGLGIILHSGLTSLERVSRSSFFTSAMLMSISQCAEHLLVYHIYHFISPAEQEMTL